jgi:hypothetical protein
VIVIETVKTLGNPYVVCFIQNGGRLARDANGGPAGWTNFEMKIHKLVERRLYLICKYTNKYDLVFMFDVKQTKKYLHNTIYEH